MIDWIPVSEKLPKDRHYVLFCDSDNDVKVGFHVKGRPVTEFRLWGTWAIIKDIVAWMPLPEPYKVESEKEEIKQESCEDYNCISRQAVLDTLNKMDKALDTDRTVESYKKLLTECYKDLPPVVPTPKKKEGKWIQAPDMPNWYWCSECGCYRDSEHDEGLLKYCPNCGAKMEE